MNNPTKYRRSGPPRFAHQTEGLRRLIKQRGVGALLMDPGLGKTSTTIDYLGALAHTQGRETRVLVLGPLAATDTWVTQLDKWLGPSVNYWAEVVGGKGSYTILRRAETLAARGGRPFVNNLTTQKRRPKKELADRHLNAHLSPLVRTRGGTTLDNIPDPRLVLLSMNIDSLRSRSNYRSRTVADVMVEAVERFDPDVLVVDEMHMIKGAGSNMSRLVARLSSRVPRRIGLTGTVMPHALTLDSPILTPTGWKPMGEMQVGGQVIGADGKPTEVVGVWPQGERPIFTVTFSDGSTVDCTEDHLWTVTSRGRRSRGLPPMTLPTGDLDKGRSRSRSTTQEVGLLDKSGSARWAIPTVEPVAFPSQPVPLDPYLTGLLLGDGHLGHSVDFTTADEKIAKYAEDALPAGLQLTVTPGQHGSRASRYRITSGKKGGSLPGTKRGPAPNAVAVALDELGLRGLRGHEKFVPDVYLWNDLETRLGVLRGLMDADGTASVGSTSKFVTTSPRLAEAIKHLVRSLGGYVTERIEQKHPTVMPQGHTAPARPQHVLLFGMPFNPFRVSRKAKQWLPRTEQKLRTIVGIEPKGTALAQCITVAAEDGLFVTRDFVVTHNSPLDVYAQWRFLDPHAFGTPRKEATYSQFEERFTRKGGYMGKEVIEFRNLDEMQDIMGQLAVVAKKEDALDLPATTDTIVRVDLSPQEAGAYANMKKQLATQFRSTDGGTSTASAATRLVQGLRLRQITAGHIKSDDGTVRTLGSSKASTARSLVYDTLVGEKRIVVFALFRPEIAQIAAAMKPRRGEPATEVMVIDGSTPAADRLAMRQRFGSDDPARIVMVAQVRTMSLAVNELVTASHAIFATLSQQRDHYVQARDRLNRLGQTRPVTFWHLIAPGTVDEAVLDAHQNRGSLENSVLRHILDETA